MGSLSTLVRGPIPLLKELAGTRYSVLAGGSAGNLTLTGITTSDVLKAVIVLDRDATAANINLVDLTSEFSITAADTINNTGGTATTGNTLLVIWIDVSQYTGV